MKLLDVFLESKTLKRAIVERSHSCDIPLKYICWELGISYNDFMRQYINVSDKSKLNISEDKFRKILEMLGISVRYQFVIDKEINMAARSKSLFEKYSTRIEKKNQSRR